MLFPLHRNKTKNDGPKVAQGISESKDSDHSIPTKSTSVMLSVMFKTLGANRYRFDVTPIVYVAPGETTLALKK